jgi:hypothetical protein
VTQRLHSIQVQKLFEISLNDAAQLRQAAGDIAYLRLH